MSMTAAKPLEEIAAQWRDARKLYVIYSALLEKFALGLPPCRDLESPVDRAEPEAIQRIAEWFRQMDERVHVHQLRQLLQTSKLGSEENLRILVNHYLEKDAKDENDRDKIDFILVQYLSTCAPPGFYEREVGFDEIAQVLEPILGEVGLHPPQWLQPLDQATLALEQFRSLRDLFGEGTLEQIRQLKVAAGDMYFGPTALVAITRFNFMVRRTFVRLIAADLHAIRFSLNELEKRGVATVDCTRAGLTAKETLENLRQICHEWKKPFRAAYAAGQNFKELIEIRGAAEEALLDVPGASVATSMPAAPLHIPVHTHSEVATSAVREQANESHDGNGIPKAVVPEIELRVEAISQPPVVHANQPIAAPIAQSSGSSSSASSSSAAAVVPAPPAISVPIVPEIPRAETPVIEPAKSAGPARAESHVTPSHPTPAPGSLDVQGAVQEIARQLTKLNVKAGAAAVAMDGVKLALSTWEVAAYSKGGDENSDTLQRVVGARAVLMAEAGRRKHGAISSALRPAIKTAQLESAKILARIAVCKQSKDIDSALHLAATSKRLLMVLEESEKFVK